MADEPAVAPVAEPAVAPVAPVVEPTYFGKDGTLEEGWQGTLDETLREDKSLSTFKTVSDLAKSFVNTKSMVGKNTMEIPTDSSAESVWEEFHKAGGRPETVADYGLKAPDGFPEDVLEKIFPQARLEAWQDRFFKGGVSKKAADKFVEEFAKDMLADYQAIEQAKAGAKAELAGNLATEFGAAFEQKMHFGDIAMEDFAGDDTALKESLAYLKEDPNAIKLLVHFGTMLAEGKSPNFSAVPTPNDYQTQIDTITENPLYLNGTTEQRMKLAEQVMALRTKMKPEPK